MRIFIDTNVYISYLFPVKSETISFLLTAIIENHTLITTSHVVEEIVEKVQNKKYLRKHITDEDLNEMLDAVGTIAEFVPIIDHIPHVCRDPKDDYLLAYAVAGRADYLVTGDEDLLEMKEYGGVKIVNPVRMLKFENK